MTDITSFSTALPDELTVVNLTQGALKRPLVISDILPADATYDLVYISSDDSVATVSAEGIVTPVSSGTVTITVSDSIADVDSELTFVVNVGPALLTVALVVKTATVTRPDGENGIIDFGDGNRKSSEINKYVFHGYRDIILGDYSDRIYVPPFPVPVPVPVFEYVDGTLSVSVDTTGDYFVDIDGVRYPDGAIAEYFDNSTNMQVTITETDAIGTVGKSITDYTTPAPVEPILVGTTAEFSWAK